MLAFPALIMWSAFFLALLDHKWVNVFPIMLQKFVVSWCNSYHKMLMEVIDESYISIEFLLKVWFSAMSM
jgi:hypothetical protein